MQQTKLQKSIREILLSDAVFSTVIISLIAGLFCLSVLDLLPEIERQAEIKLVKKREQILLETAQRQHKLYMDAEDIRQIYIEQAETQWPSN